MVAVTKHDALAVLQGHIGRNDGISVEQLAAALDTPARRVRALVSELREEGVAVCAHPALGYYIAQTPEEVEHCCAFLRSRAMHTLVLESRLRKISLPELLGQLRLKT